MPTKPVELTPLKLLALTVLALLAFAGNSLLTRAALRDTEMDPGSFIFIRLLSGALTLIYLLWLRNPKVPIEGSWRGAWALVIYAVAFSVGYVHIDAGLGSLFLFGAVQLSMTAWGIYQGERLNRWQWLGVGLAIGGLVYLTLPNATDSADSVTINPLAVVLMIVAGSAWGAYSLLGRGSDSPLANTTSNFVRALPIAMPFIFLMWMLDIGRPWNSLDPAGAAYATASGVLTSAIGYAIWYRALPGLSAAQAATVQLSVPVITAFIGILWLNEVLTIELVIVSLLSLSGIGLMMFCKHRS